MTTNPQADRLEKWKERLSLLDPYDDNSREAVRLAEELFAEVEWLSTEQATYKCAMCGKQVKP